jgi:transposase-like protein
VIRVRRSITEKRRIVELTFLPGESVARVAQAEGVNSHQVFQWRRAFRRANWSSPDLRPYFRLSCPLHLRLNTARGSPGRNSRHRLAPFTSSFLAGL